MIELLTGAVATLAVGGTAWLVLTEVQEALHIGQHRKPEHYEGKHR